MNDVNTLIKKWLKNLIYVSTSIVFSLLLTVSQQMLENMRTGGMLGNTGLLRTWLKESPFIIMPIAFLLVLIFLLWIFYTSYIIIRISRVIYYSTLNLNNMLQLALLFFSNCIFFVLIALIGNHCLQGNIKTSMSLSLIWNFLLQSLVLMPILFVNKLRKLTILKAITISLIFFSIFVIYNKNAWIYETINPSIQYFCENYTKLNMIIKIIRFLHWPILLTMYFCAVHYIIKPKESHE